jgi:hypothetical protein
METWYNQSFKKNKSYLDPHIDDENLIKFWDQAPKKQ